MKKIHSIILIILSICLAGCGCQHKLNLPDEVQKPIVKPGKPVKEYFVSDVVTSESNLDLIPETIVQINLQESMKFSSFIQILIDQGINIISKIETDFDVSMPMYLGSLRSLLRSLQNGYGIFIIYNDGVVYFRDTAPCYVKVLMPDAKDTLEKLLQSFGVKSSFYDVLSSRVSFTTDFYTYDKIRRYFKQNPYLTFAILDVMVLENDSQSDYKHGIDFSQLALSLTESTTLPLAASIKGGLDGQFSVSFTGQNFSLQQVFKSLDESYDFRVLQSARVSTLNGLQCEFDVSERIPYVEDTELSTIGNDNTLVQAYKFGEQKSGVNIKLTPTISSDLISLDFNIEVNSLIKFIDVGSAEKAIQQPVMSTRSLHNRILMQPGQSILVGGLRYDKGSLLNSGLSFKKAWGYSSDSIRTFSITILVRAELHRYVFI